MLLNIMILVFGLDLLELRAVLGPVAHPLAVVAGGTGRWVPLASGLSSKQLHELVHGDEGIVPRAHGSVVGAVVLVPVGALTLRWRWQT